MSKKTLAAIRREQQENAEQIKAQKKAFEQSRQEWEQLPDGEKVAYIKGTEAGARIMREWDRIAAEIDKREMLAKILTHNYKKELAATVAPVLAEILKKYKGKPAGEKTREKIKQELATACECFAYFPTDYDGAARTCCVCECSGGYVSGARIELFFNIYDTYFIDKNNIIQEIDAAEIRTSGGVFIKNPAKRLEELDKAKTAAEKAKTAYNIAVEQYNKLTVEGIENLEKIYK